MVSVVVVEDEKVLRRGLVLATPWKEYGCRIVGDAGNGIEGEELILKVNPDIVITDVIMPGLNGIEMIERLYGKVEAEYIILSGYADFAFAQQAIKLGVKRYLLKPIDEKELKDTIKDLVGEIKKREKSLHFSNIITNKGVDRDLFFKEYIVNHNRDYKEKYLEEALSLIEKHYAENLTASDVAEYLGISESSFVKLFKNRTGYTYLKYLTLYRMKNSIKFLADKSKRTTEVAAMVGYSDYRYFSEVFKKYLGITPNEYRKGKY